MNIVKLCQTCKKCCIGTEIRLTPENIERWKKEDRLDILLCINPLLGESRQLIKKENSNECFFLTSDGKCSIQETKPYICKKFPVSRKQAELFECKLIDVLHLK